MTEYKDELKPYVISAEDLVNLTALHSEFHKLLLLPAELLKDIKTATANIKKIITKILTLLRESIDNDILQYQDDKPEIYEKYMVLREIDDSQTTALSFKGKILEDDDDCDGTEECPLQYVKVTAKFRAGHGYKEVLAVSTKLGNYQFKGIPEGKCTLIFTLEYYNTVVVESVVRADKFTRVDVKMKKS